MAGRVDDDVELVWSGPFRNAMRPSRFSSVVRLSQIGAVLYVLAGMSSLPILVGWVELDGGSLWWVGISTVGALMGGVALFAIAARVTPEQAARWLPLISLVGLTFPCVAITGSLVSVGPEFGVVAVFYVQAPLLGWAFLERRWAFALSAVMVASYAFGVLLVDDIRAPAEHLLIIVCAAGSTSFLVGDLARRSDEAERAERAARLELADLNQHLEQRVADQVDELERVGQLRRFLAPQVADVVVSRGSEALLEPHRRDVAVLFCDLRGFTRFTNAVDPDTVVSVLGEYYAAIGSVLEGHGATIGGYEGDGVMAYVGDPVPRPDAAEAAVAMAREIGVVLDHLTGSWREHGHDLGYGIGLAHGEATLGVVGFDGRFDYTPLGAVVNLAARLCADAGPGEIVVDGSLLDVTGGARHRGDVDLKGFDAPVPTYALTR